MLELLSPAGSTEGVAAAVRNGADAVYMGFGNFNARRNAKNFSEEEFAEAAEFCRVRNVKFYVTLNTLAADRELNEVAETAKRAARCGADAILVQDLGVLRAVRQAVPDMPIHASTQMSIHNLEGVRMAAAMGLSRVVLARELTGEEIRYICANSPIETEVFVHGALCMCYSGQCYMSAVIGQRSGNRGLCAQPCRMKYAAAARKNDYPLSLKDNCLAPYLRQLEEYGVTCVKIEGRMKRPEYTAIVTDIYSRAIREGRCPNRAETALLQASFSRQGFTDGYFTGKTGPDMFGVRTEADKGLPAEFAAARRKYISTEFPRVPVRFVGLIRAGEPARLAAEDDRGNRAMAEGPVPEPAFHRELTTAALRTQLAKTGGTPFVCTGARASIEPGLTLPLAAVNAMRRSLLETLMNARKTSPAPTLGHYVPVQKRKNREEPPVLTASFMKAGQLSPALEGAGLKLISLPLEELRRSPAAVQPFLHREDVAVAAIMPRVIKDGQWDEVRSFLDYVRNLGVTQVLTGNLGQIVALRSMGFTVRGDFGLNVFNSGTLETLQKLGLESAALSFELKLAQVRDISKCMDTELIVYGRLPLMITENCIVKSSTGICGCDSFPGITDRTGLSFPVVKEYGCRSVVLNSKKLFLADRKQDYASLGLWAARLAFTTENPSECARIVRRYAGLDDYEPVGFTRGLYYRGVD